MTALPTRRAFLARASLGALAVWLAPSACAPTADGAPTNLTASETRTLRAVARRILPSDDGLPGAEEANAIAFVDRAIAMPFYAEQTAALRTGLTELGARGFASLDASRQDAMLRAIEETPFFVAARALVITGVFADPAHGGNRGGAGWKLVGIEHRERFAPPFGWYAEHVS